MRDSQIEIYSNKHAEMINSLNDNRLNYYIIGIIEEIAEKDTIELEEDNVLDVSDEYLKLEALEGIYNSIERDEDKIFFATAISENASLLGIRIAEEFANKLNALKANTEESGDNEEDVEEVEEEKELDTPTPSFDTDTDVPPATEEPEEEEPEKEEEKAPEQPIEGPAITEYKAKTAEMEKELAELMAKLGNIDEPSNEMDEIINNTSYPEIEEFENKINEVTAEIENLDKEIATKTEEKARYEKLKEDYDKFYEERNIPKTQGDYRQKMDIYDQRIKECEASIKSNVEKKSYKEQELDMLNKKMQEVSGPLYKIEVWKLSELYNKEIEKLENNLKELNEIQDKLYKESKGIPLEIYGMKTKLENQIKEMKDVFIKTVGIRSDINLNNPEFKPILDAVKNGRKINNEVNEELNEKFRVDNKDLNDLAEKLKEEIEKRKENIAKYYDALNDIKNLGNEIKAGKTPEELKENIDQINNKIETITDDKLKEELKDELNKALNPEKEQEKEVPEKPGDVKKDPKKWKKWISGIAGLALGAGIIALTPLTGIAGGLAVVAGSQLLKKGVNVYHNHLVKKAQELPKENEVSNIEKTGKLTQFKEKIKGWFLDENIVKNINWFLNGTSIGAMSMGLLEASTGINYGNWTAPKVASSEVVAPEMANGTTDPYSNVKIGDSANGLDLSKGYDQANWASQNINAESLNQTIMQDGNSIIDSVRVTKDGVTHVVDTAGKSLTEVAQQLGVNPEDLVMNITNGQGAPRAWVDAAEAVGRTL